MCACQAFARLRRVIFSFADSIVTPPNSCGALNHCYAITRESSFYCAHTQFLARSIICIVVQLAHPNWSIDMMRYALHTTSSIACLLKHLDLSNGSQAHSSQATRVAETASVSHWEQGRIISTTGGLSLGTWGHQGLFRSAAPPGLNTPSKAVHAGCCRTCSTGQRRGRC